MMTKMTKTKNEETLKGPVLVPQDGGVLLLLLRIVMLVNDGVRIGEKGVADKSLYPVTLDGGLASQLLRCQVRS